MAKETIKLIQEKLSSNEILFILRPANIFYVLNKNIDGVVMAFTKSKIYVFCSNMILGQLKNLLDNNFNLIVGETFEERIAQISLKDKLLLFDDEDLPLRIYKIFKKYTNKIKFSSMLKELRMVKNKDEINNIKMAIQIIKKVLKDIKNFLKVGITEKELKNLILQKIFEYGSEPSFDPIVAFDENTSFPHHASNNKKFKENSLVLIDLGCKYNGYCCDVTRMYNVNKNKSVKNLYIKLKNLQKILISMCKPGVVVKKIDEYARRYFEELGLRNNYLHATGHGLGIEIHEAPKITTKEDVVLKENMVITVEPGVYFNNKFGLRIEDDVICSFEPKVITKEV